MYWVCIGIPLGTAMAQDQLESKLVDRYQALPGEVSVVVLRDKMTLVELNAEQPLAIASAFKLQVLAELQHQIEAGQHAWDEVVTLNPEAKSIPSGILQDWPDQAPLTLQTLASLMISVSDNTAADVLIQVVGRESLATASPRNQPFLTTQEVFTLKSPENEDVLAAYRQSSSPQDLLPTIHKAPLPPVELVDSQPLAPDIEWFFTTRELCQLIAQVADLPLMQINTGVINSDNWQQVAFKGGAEPGVLNLTAALTNDAGTNYCVSATWNDQQPLEEYRFFNLFSDTLQSLDQ
ncbi:serine hydrolase [Acaryochloris sp. IP29b_bin.148]|uniref:serine hydrolase n=1 Tax=Acaryochloris sp. IP29b_bin.148 TaxID=2969218 RepID=UPI00262082AF|nr:serine hydrolase [Acaryochloris sp. IP29b_bin.148]